MKTDVRCNSSNGHILVLLIGTLGILLGSGWPWRVRQRRLAVWVTTWLARTLLFIFNVKVNCTDREKLRQHRGFIFPTIFPI